MDYITGASGFIGSRLAARLEDASCLSHKTYGPGFALKPFDRFFFLSAYGNINGQHNRDKAVDANLLTLIHTFTEARKFNFKSFIYASSSAVLRGKPTPYSHSKRAAEEYLQCYAEPVCITRLYTVTGVGDQSVHLIPTLIRSCLRGELVNFTLWPQHDFIDVEDVVDNLLNLAADGTKGIYEIRNGRSYTNREVLSIVESVTGKKANIQVVEQERAYDVHGSLPTPNTWVGGKKSLEQSIAEMVEHERTRTPNN